MYTWRRRTSASSGPLIFHGVLYVLAALSFVLYLHFPSDPEPGDTGEQYQLIGDPPLLFIYLRWMIWILRLETQGTLRDIGLDGHRMCVESGTVQVTMVLRSLVT